MRPLRQSLDAARPLREGLLKVDDVLLRSWRPSVWLFALAFAAYARTLGFGFSPLDDRWAIASHLDELTRFRALATAFTHPMFDIYYRPVLGFSFVVDALIGRGSPWVFHLTNILLHGLAATAVFALLLKLTLSREAALLFAALFAAHPAHVHAVAWIPGRNDLLLAIFTLGAVISFIDYQRSPRTGALWTHLGLFALALLTKESAALLPLVLLAYGWCGTAPKLRLRTMAPAWAAAIALWAAVWWSIVPHASPVRGWDLLRTAHDSGAAFVVFAGKLVVPVQQAVFPTVRDSSLAPGLAVLAAVGIVSAWRGFSDKGTAAFGAVWFLMFLALPLLHGTWNGIGEHYEHRLYVPSIGFLLFASKIDWLGPAATVRARRALVASCVVLIAIFSSKTVFRCATYRSDRSIAEAGVRESPNLYFAYNVRGRLSSEAGDYEPAVADFQRALGLLDASSPMRAKIELRLADGLSKLGRSSESVDHYLEAMKKMPEDADLRASVANDLARLGRLDEAIEQYSESLAIQPNSAKVHNNLGVVLVRRGSYAEGARHFAEALRLQPDYPGAQHNLERAQRLLSPRAPRASR